MEKRNIRVMIADDHNLYRLGLRTLLSQIKNVEIVGEAVNGQDLVRHSADLQPDVILTDIGMPVMDGVAATRELARRKINNRVIVLSAYSREEPVLQMLEAGALGYVLKTAETDEIADAINTVYKHKPYFCKEITERLTDIVSKSYQMPVRADIFFTEREKEIMKYICQEFTSKEIAFAIHVSKRTVEGHRTRIMDKIGAKSIAGIIRYAIEKGIYKK